MEVRRAGYVAGAGMAKSISTFWVDGAMRGQLELMRDAVQHQLSWEVV